MIEEYTLNGSGWARFSPDEKHRYRLGRMIRALDADTARDFWITRHIELRRVVFLMLNPSTANAFKPDPTVSRCIKFASMWGADIVEVVNLFSLRSTQPAALYDGARVAPGQCGDYSHAWRSTVGGDPTNDEQIIDACRGAHRVIAAWGNHGELANRGADVAAMLAREGVKLEALRILSNGNPSHPLARGKAFISYETAPVGFA